MITKEEVLQKCRVEGTIIKLPTEQIYEKLDRKLYQEIAKSFELIGGKWKGGKTMGFVFNEDPTDLLEQISNGENRNLKKEFQFFETPKELADKLVSYSNINNSHKILEPSAGQGAIIEAIRRKIPNIPIDCFELMPLNQTFLNKIQGVNILGSNFLTETGFKAEFDSIIANPPFSKNQDIDHVYRMYEVCKKGGRIVTITSKHWQNSNNKKEIQFKSWINDIGAEIIEIESGAFKESGTSIAAAIIVINK